MAMKRIPAGVGLWTDGAGTTAPEGAMRVADHVCIRRPGLITPRPGFGDLTGLSSPTVTNVFDDRYLPAIAWPYDGELVVASETGDDWRLHCASSGAALVTGIAPPSNRGVPDAAEMRSNLYVTTSAGLIKLTDGTTSGTTRTLAGAWTYYQAPVMLSKTDLTSAGEDADHASVNSNSSVAYRWVLRKSDANGYERRSAPSSREIVRVPSSYSTGARITLGTIKIHPEWEAGDVLELYRTRNSGSETADPGEDYYLCAEHVITSTEITNTVTDDDIWDDRVPDDALGPALYSSISQLGARASKEVPPQGEAVAEWGGCLWLGSLTERVAQTIQIREVRATPASDGTGLCGDITGSWSGVSGNDLTGVTLSAAEWSCLANGMWISDASNPTASLGTIPLNTKIEAFDQGAGTITLSQAPSSTGNFIAGDIVDVNGTTFYCFTSEGIASQWFEQSTDADPATRCYETSLSLARAIAYNAETCSATALKDELIGAGDGTFLILEDQPWGNDLTLTCAARGSAFVPDITDGYSVHTNVRHIKPGAIAWSSPNEPEAFPVTQTAVVGNVERRILALTPLDAALLVWKEDGLYRVTGTPPDGIVIDEITASSSSPLRLLSEQCVAVLGGAAYGWTDQGIVEVTEGGIRRVISEPIADVLRSKQTLLPRDNSDDRRGFWLRAHPRRGELILGVADAATDDYADELYVWSRTTGAWTRWPLDAYALAYDPTEDRAALFPRYPAWSLPAVTGFSASKYYSMPTTNDLDGSAAMTRSVLFRLDSITGAVQDLLENYDSGLGGYVLQVKATGEVIWQIYDGSPHAVQSAVLTAGNVYCVTATWDGTNQRIVVNSTATNATPGITYVQATSSTPGFGANSSGTNPATGLTILGAAASDSTALSESDAIAHNEACLGTGIMQTFTGIQNLWRAPDLETDLAGGLDWTVNGSPTSTTISVGPEWLAFYERTDEADGGSYRDATATSIEIVSTTATTVTVRQSAFSGARPKACDLILIHDGISSGPGGGPPSGGYGWVKVTDVATSGGYYVLTVGSVRSGSQLDWMQGWEAVCQWQGQQLAGLGQRWQEIHVDLEETESEYLTDDGVSEAPLIDVGGAAHRDSAVSTVSETFPESTTYSNTIRVGVPRACARTQHLYPYAKVCGAGMRWELAGVTLHHTPTSRRVSR